MLGSEDVDEQAATMASSPQMIVLALRVGMITHRGRIEEICGNV